MLLEHDSTILLQAAAFDGWVEAVELLRHNRQIASQAARRLSNIRLSQVFNRLNKAAASLFCPLFSCLVFAFQLRIADYDCCLATKHTLLQAAAPVVVLHNLVQAGEGTQCQCAMPA